MDLSHQVTRRHEAVDCFNCSTSGRSCDRTRHRCSTCAQFSQLCQGYPRELQWLKGITSRGKQKGKSISIDASNTDWESTTPTNHTFIFKPGRPQKRCRNRIKTPKQQDRASPISQLSQNVSKSNYHESHQLSVSAGPDHDNIAIFEGISASNPFTILDAIFDGSNTHIQQTLCYNNDINSDISLSMSPSFTLQEQDDPTTSPNSSLFPLSETFPKAYMPTLNPQPQLGHSELLSFCV